MRMGMGGCDLAELIQCDDGMGRAVECVGLGVADQCASMCG